MTSGERYLGTEVEWGTIVQLRPKEDAAQTLSPERQNGLMSMLLKQVAKQTIVSIPGLRLEKIQGGHNSVEDTAARVYLDVGDHPEYATPECTTALKAKDHEMLGEGFMGTAFETAARVILDQYGNEVSAGGYEIVLGLTKKNCTQRGQAPSGSLFETWGVHENHQTLRESTPNMNEDSDTVRSFAAHNVTRIIYTGAGGFIGDKYWIAPRAFAISNLVSSGTTRARGIVNTKDEPLARDEKKFRRIHNITGEGNVSPEQIYMKLATTAAVIKAMEQGVNFADLCPVDPVAAMHQIGSDLTLNVAVQLPDGSHRSAIEIQREILRRVRPYLSTPDERRLEEEWERVLDALERRQREDRVTRALRRYLCNIDWIAKIELFRGQAGSTAYEQRIDREYAVLTDSKGNVGHGYKLREKGLFDMMPEVDLSAVAAKSLPSSNRALMRTMFLRSPLSRQEGNKTEWEKYWIGGEQHYYPDHPTDADVERFAETIKAAEERSCAA